ncbi:hypothetical protein RhiirA4_471106 [Rhizophagus irregularis]|uniref:Uncharacterized protein n=1 Tax=Rhizophagus irregularis TaxID=588596 RepID=A0A2I1H2H0_9GLOM|nr:hypothetical protein RhiirA4_471106 [Rhizophagus irregularis]
MVKSGLFDPKSGQMDEDSGSSSEYNTAPISSTKWYSASRVRSANRDLLFYRVESKIDKNESLEEAHKRMFINGLIKSESLSVEEELWTSKASTGSIIWAEPFEGNARQYDGIYRVNIEGLPKKSAAQCSKLFRYNQEEYYTHHGKEKWSRKQLFANWARELIKIKREKGIAGKVAKELLVSL